MTNVKLFNVVFVLGPPGSGKGTQCAKIQKELGYVHLSSDLLRAECERPGSEFSDLIKGHIRAGTIAPAEITCALLRRAMEASGEVRGFLIDGFPRNQNNLDGWQKEMADRSNVRFVLYLTCPIDTCVNRCLHRGQGRIDDNEDSLWKRVNTYNNQTWPIIKHYAQLGLVKEVDSTRDPDEVFSDIAHLFSQIV